MPLFSSREVKAEEEARMSDITCCGRLNVLVIPRAPRLEELYMY